MTVILHHQYDLIPSLKLSMNWEVHLWNLWRRKGLNFHVATDFIPREFEAHLCKFAIKKKPLARSRNNLETSSGYSLRTGVTHWDDVSPGSLQLETRGEAEIQAIDSMFGN